MSVGDTTTNGTLESQVDVLIVGAGPAGVMVSLSQFARREEADPDDGTGRRRASTIHCTRSNMPHHRQAQWKARQWCVACGGEMLSRSKTDHCIETGQADGLNSRSMEIFESLGFVESIEKEGSRMVSFRERVEAERSDSQTRHHSPRSTSGTLIPILDVSLAPPRCEQR